MTEKNTTPTQKIKILNIMINEKDWVLQAKDEHWNYYSLPLMEDWMQKIPLDLNEWDLVDTYYAFEPDELKEFYEHVKDLEVFEQEVEYL